MVQLFEYMWKIILHLIQLIRKELEKYISNMIAIKYLCLYITDL